MFGVEKSIGDVVKMTTARIHLPCLGFAHSPNLDDSIICSRDDKRESMMEHCVVDAAIVTFKHMFDSRKVVKSFEIAWTTCTWHSSWTWIIGWSFSKPRDVPYANCLIHRGWNYKVFFWMELCGHDIMWVASEDGNALTGCTVPDTNCLIIWARKLPNCIKPKKVNLKNLYQQVYNDSRSKASHDEIG